jgi:hypothetical protein
MLELNKRVNGVVVTVQEKDLHFIIAQRFKCMWGNHLSWFYERDCRGSNADFVYLSTYSGLKGIHVFEVKMPYDKDYKRTQKQLSDYLKIANYIHFIGVDCDLDIENEFVTLWRFDSQTLQVRKLPNKPYLKRQNRVRTQERHIFLLALLNDLFDRVAWSKDLLPEEWQVKGLDDAHKKIEEELRGLYVQAISE